MRVIAGCDGGGTKCHVQISIVDAKGKCTQTSDALAGPANVKSNPELALENIRHATELAMRNLELPTEPKIDQFVLGLAGAGSATIREEWQVLLAQHLSVKNIKIVPDATILFAAANLNREESAIALVVGTGAIAWARNSRGETSRAGGLGPEHGDEGSAFWIGREAVRRLPKDYPNISIDDYQALAKLSQSVFERNDQVATEITTDAAKQIAQLLIDCVLSLIHI